MDIKTFKTLILNEAKNDLKEKMMFLRETIITTQKEANSHKGAMQSRYDTFKEEAQYLRGGYEKQLSEAINDLKILNQIIPDESSTIKLGTIIRTIELQNGVGDEIERTYFISTSVSSKPIIVNGIEVTCIRYTTPFINAIHNKYTGEVITFRDKTIEIREIL